MTQNYRTEQTASERTFASVSSEISPLYQWRTQEFCSGSSRNSVEDRGHKERRSGGGSPLLRCSGGSCNLVQEISFHIVKVFFNSWYFKSIYGDNQFICHCKYKTIVNLGSFRILLPFFRTSWCVGVLNSAIFNSFQNRDEFGTILEGLWNFGRRGVRH